MDTGPHRVAALAWGGVLVVAAALPRQVAAQAERPSFDVNVPYAHYYGTGSYRFGDERVLALSLRGELALRAFTPERVGVSFRASGLVAWQHVGISDTLDATVQVLTLVPGLGLDIPLGRTVVLRPFLDLGAVRDVAAQSWFTLGTIGAGLEWVQPWEQQLEIGVEPAIGYSRTFSSDPRADDDLLVAGVALDARRRVGLRVFGEAADLGGYIKLIGFWGDTDLSAAPDEPQEIERQIEFGVSFGTHPRPKIWLFRLPRLWMGFRFGTGFSGLRIGFGDRRLRIPQP